MRTIYLRERVPRPCCLPRADVDFLLVEHRPHLDIVPTGQRGRYRLTPTGYVGTILTPSSRLVIRPKIPLVNLFHLFDPAGPLPVVDDRSQTVTGTEALDFLAGRLAQLLRERAAAGLHRGYAERAEQGGVLHGCLDVATQLRESPARRDVLHSRYEELTADVPCNQVPRAVAELVLRSPLITDRVRDAVRQGLAGFDGVTPAPLAPDAFLQAAPDALTEAYRPLIDLCRLLAEGLSPGERGGTTTCPAFLLNLERVFEKYVTRGIVEGFAGRERCQVVVQPLCVANRPVNGQPDIHLRPDLLILYDGQPDVVIDAKWKDLGSSPPDADDICQVVAYCAALGSTRGVLVYPGQRDRLWEYQLAGSPITLVIRTLRVVGAREKCQRSLRRLARCPAGG